MSEVKVNKLSPRSGTTVTLGDSGDTFTVPSGVTFDASSGGLAGTLTTAAQPNITSVGTLTSFTSTGIDDNATSTAMTISSGGVVSIGTTSTSGGWQVKVAGSNAPLELARTAGDTSERSHLGFTREGTFVGQFKSDATNLWLEASAGALIINTGGGSERMRIDSSGNVGIGTSSPSSLLNILGTTADADGALGSKNPQFVILGGNANNPLEFGMDNSGGTAVGFIQSRNTVSGVQYLSLNPSGGNVGIGETSPLGKLHVKTADSGGTPNSQYDELVLEQNGNNCGMTILCNSPGDGAIYFGDSADNDIGGIAYSHFDNKMFFKVNASERMRIDSSGNVGIGTTSPANKLDVDGDVQISPDFAGGGTARKRLGIGTYASNGSSAGMEFSTFSVSGDSIVQYCSTVRTAGTNIIEFHNPNGEVGSIATSGSSTSFNTSSDYRLKENINYDFDATTRLKQLKPARFNFIADADTTVDGFIAHEVSSVVPEAISKEKDAVKEDGTPDYQGIDQSKLVPLLVKTIQELEARITQLENA